MLLEAHDEVHVSVFLDGAGAAEVACSFEPTRTSEASAFRCPGAHAARAPSNGAAHVLNRVRGREETDQPLGGLSGGRDGVEPLAQA